MIAVSVIGCRDAVDVAPPPLPDLSAAFAEVAEFVEARHQRVVENLQSAEAWGEYAMALDAHEFDDDAVTAYQTAVELDGDEPRWRYLLARKIQSGAPEEALQHLTVAAMNPHATLAMHLLRHDLLIAAGRTADAGTALQRAEEIAAEHPAVVVRRAQALFDTADFEDASRVLNELRQDFQETVRLRARLRAAGLELDNRAVESSELPPLAATVADPDLDALNGCRRDPLWRGKHAADRARAGDRLAMMTLQGLVHRYPELVENRLQLALLIHAGGDKSAAREIVEEGLELTPGDTRLLAGKASLATMDADWQSAEQVLRQLTEKDPGHEAGWADLGFVLEQQAQVDDAIAAYEKALALNPTDNELVQHVQALRERGESQATGR